MPLFSFNETTLALLLIFALFIITIYSIIRITLRVALIAIISMAFPIILAYLGLYENITIDVILIFGILGAVFYIIFFATSKALDIVWPSLGFFKKGKTEKKHPKKKHKKEEEEYEIPEQ